MGKTLGERIATLLKEKNMTQKDFAYKVGITEAALSHYIKGDRIPRSVVMTKMAQEFSVSSDFLMDGIPENKQEDLIYAKKLIARNVDKMTLEEKKEILNILMGS